jgi:hypothetical protein
MFLYFFLCKSVFRLDKKYDIHVIMFTSQEPFDFRTCVIMGSQCALRLELNVVLCDANCCLDASRLDDVADFTGNYGYEL